MALDQFGNWIDDDDVLGFSDGSQQATVPEIPESEVQVFPASQPPPPLAPLEPTATIDQINGDQATLASGGQTRDVDLNTLPDNAKPGDVIDRSTGEFVPPAQVPSPPEVLAPPPVAPLSSVPGAQPIPDTTPTPFQPQTPFQPPPGARQKVTRSVANPEMLAAQADAAKLEEARVTAERNASLVKQQTITGEAKFAAQQAAAALEAKQRTEQLIKDHDVRLASIQQRQAETYEAVRAFKYHDYWSDKSVGDKILARLATFLGGYGAAQLHMENPVLKSIEANVNRDFQRQENDLKQKWELYAATSKDYDRARQSFADGKEMIELKKSAAKDSLADQLTEWKIKQGIPAEVAANDKAVLAIRQSAIEDRLKLAKETQEKVEWDTYNKARGGAGGGVGSPAETKYLEMLQNKATPAELNAFAAANRIDSKTQDKLVARAEKLFTGARNEAKGSGGGSGNAQSALRRERVAANIHEFNVNADRLVDGIITPEVLQKVQDNESRIKGVEHSTVNQVAGRWVGLVPRSKYDGLTPEQTTAMRALDATLQHGAEMQPTTGAEVSHQWKETYRPTAGMAQEDIDRSVRNIKEMGHTFKKIIDPTDIGGRAQTGEAPSASQEPTAPKLPPTRREKAAAATRVLDNPNAPPDVRRRAREYLQSLGQ